MEPVLLYITAPNREEAISLARDLLAERLIACANVVDHATSLYWWSGEIDQTTESLIVAKSVAGKVEGVIARVKSGSSYDCPCVVSVPITGGNPEYLEWLRKETAASS